MSIFGVYRCVLFIFFCEIHNLDESWRPKAFFSMRKKCCLQYCVNYRPAHGGKYCVGERRRYRSCNIQVRNEHYSDFFKFHYLSAKADYESLGLSHICITDKS